TIPLRTPLLLGEGTRLVSRFGRRVKKLRDFFSRPKPNCRPGWDFDLRARFRISATSRRTLMKAKCAKAAKFDTFAPPQRINQGVEHRVYNGLSIGPGHARLCATSFAISFFFTFALTTEAYRRIRS